MQKRRGQYQQQQRMSSCYTHLTVAPAAAADYDAPPEGNGFSMMLICAVRREKASISPDSTNGTTGGIAAHIAVTAGRRPAGNRIDAFASQQKGSHHTGERHFVTRFAGRCQPTPLRAKR